MRGNCGRQELASPLRAHQSCPRRVSYSRRIGAMIPTEDNPVKNQVCGGKRINRWRWVGKGRARPGHVHDVLLRDETDGALNLHHKVKVSIQNISVLEDRHPVRNQVIDPHGDTRDVRAPSHPQTAFRTLTTTGPGLARALKGRNNSRRAYLQEKREIVTVTGVVKVRWVWRSARREMQEARNGLRGLEGKRGSPVHR